MNIGIDIRTLMDEHYSGVSIYTSNLLQEMLKQDNSNNYILFYNSFADKSQRIPKFQQSNVSVKRYSYPNKILNYFLFNLWGWPKIDRQLQVDLFFMPHINFIALSKKAKSIVVVHDLSFLHYPYFFTFRQNLWHRSLKLRKLLNNATYIIAVSENTKQDIIRFYNVDADKIKVIYSGIDPVYKIIDRSNVKLHDVRQKYNLPKKFILYLGNIEPRKNIESIVEAYILWRDNNPAQNIHLVIAGKPAWKHNIVKTIANNCSYKNDIHFLGYIESDDKPYLYNLASLFMFPSFYEGFGFPPLEAAACGVPVIASNRASLPEIMGNSAILVNPHNITEIKEAMEQIFNDRDLQKSLISAGIKQAQKYSWQKCAEQVTDIFYEIKS